MEEALRKVVARLTVYVHPSNAKRVHHAIARQLSALLFTYEDRFDGMLLAHHFTLVADEDKEGKPQDKNGEPKDKSGNKKGKHRDKKGEPQSCVKAKIIPQDKNAEPKDKSDKSESCVKAKIMNGLVPYFGVQVQAEMLLFSPHPDMILEGKVEMLGKESIHAVVLGVFSVAIMSDDIHGKFKFKRRSGGGKFVSRSDRQHVIERGTMIRFSVKRVDTEMNCHITGSLIPPHTGSMEWLSVHDTEYASEINSTKMGSRGTSLKIEQNEQEHGSVKNEDSIVKSERTSKSRKRRINEDSMVKSERPYKSRKGRINE